MTGASTVPILWDNPEPGIYEAITQRTQDVTLEVYEANPEDEAGHFTWWVFAGGREIDSGEADGLAAAKAACEAALR